MYANQKYYQKITGLARLYEVWLFLYKLQVKASFKYACVLKSSLFRFLTAAQQNHLPW